MGRLSMSQPGHRRPSWAQTEHSYRTYIADSVVKSRATADPDFGLDNFSFDADHVAEWQLPSDIAPGDLPPALRVAAEDWVYAGAALCTALERILRLYKTAVARAYPTTSHPHLMSRSSTLTSDGSTSAETPPSGGPDSPKLYDSSLGLSLDNLILNSALSSPRTQRGMESPPFTPTDTQGCTTPEYPPLQSKDATLNAERVTASQPSPPLSTRSSFMISNSTTGSNKEFDESAWETFQRACTAERVDLRSNALMRLKGCTRTIDRLLVELQMERALHDSNAEYLALENFTDWWRTLAKGKAEIYEARVKRVEIPTLESLKVAS